MSVRTSPGLFHGFDVFGFSHGRTKPIWRSKLFYKVTVVFHGMLAREGEASGSRLTNSELLENRVIVMVRFEHGVEFVQVMGRKGCAACDVAEVDVGGQGANYFARDMAFNTIDVNPHERADIGEFWAWI